MRLLLVDHGCCDHPHTRIHALRAELIASGVQAHVCGPSSVPSLERQPAGMHGMHLHDVAAASRSLLAAVREGSANAFVAAVGGVPARLLGLVRETARQTIAEATDACDPDAIFVLHAGILADLAVETGAPVVVYVAAEDLAVTATRPSLRRLVAAAIGSSDGVIAADEPTAAAVRRECLAGDPDGRCEHWPFGPGMGHRVSEACARAAARRRR